MKIGGFTKTSAADGPGMRTVLFLQGCTKKCVGCHNTLLQNVEGGIEVELAKIVALIEKNCLNHKLTISGGEPMEQLPQLLTLLEQLHKLHYDICLYTSWSLEQVPQEVRRCLHYLKVGEFILAQKTALKPFVGSQNQIMYELDAEGVIIGECN